MSRIDIGHIEKSPFIIPNNTQMTEGIHSPATSNVYQDSFPNMTTVQECLGDDIEVTKQIDGGGCVISYKPRLSSTSPSPGRSPNLKKKKKGSNLLGRLRIIKATSSIGCSRRSDCDQDSGAPPNEVVLIDGQRECCVSPASCGDREAHQHHNLVEELLASCSRRVVTIPKPCRFTFDVVPSMSSGDSPTTAVCGDDALSSKNENPILDGMANNQTTGPRSSHSGDTLSEQVKVHFRARTRTSSTELTSSTTASSSKDTQYRTRGNQLNQNRDANVIQSDVKDGDKLVSFVSNEHTTESSSWFSFSFFVSWFF